MLITKAHKAFREWYKLNFGYIPIKPKRPENYKTESRNTLLAKYASYLLLRDAWDAAIDYQKVVTIKELHNIHERINK